MSEDQVEQYYPEFEQAETFILRIYYACISVTFISLVLLVLLQFQVLPAFLPAAYFGAIASVAILIVSGYLSTLVYRRGIPYLAGFWEIARLEDTYTLKESSPVTSFVFFMHWVIAGIFTLITSSLWSMVDTVPNSNLYSVITNNPQPYEFTQVIFIHAASSASFVALIVTTYILFFRAKLRVFPNYYCPECGEEVDQEWVCCPQCGAQYDEPNARRRRQRRFQVPEE